MQLENKKIIVTGGTKGIGVATAKLYVKEGAQVVFCGTNDERGKATEEAANAQPGPGHATYIRCDISNKEAALSGMPNGAAYAASKGAVLSWTRSIAMEWGIECNVRCNCVNPTIKTVMYEEWLRTVNPAVKEMHLAGLKRRYPIDGSMCEAERDCAPIMVFLASEASRYISGQIFCVNGGTTMVR